MSSNPVVEAWRGVSAALAAMTLDYGSLSAEEIASVMRELSRHEARVTAHKFALTEAAVASDAARSQGAATPGSLWANTFGGDRAAGDRVVHQSRRMSGAPATQQALGKGLISAGQADVIAATIEKLPSDVSDKDRQACEDTLIAAAPTLRIKDLRRRADRIAEIYAPDKADKIENETLQERERRAWAQVSFWMNDQNDGTHKGGFVLPDLPAEQLQKIVDVLMAPRNNHADADDPVLLDTRPSASQRAGFAFAELIQRYPTDVLPGSKDSDGAQLLVNIEYDTLAGAVVPATLETGTRISAQEALRLACEMSIMPVVFDGKALPTHLGRQKRLFNRAQRRALATRDGGCAFPGCDRPPSWCEAHHAGNPWACQGETNLDEGVLLCCFHHRLIHHSDWSVRIVDDIPEFLPPAALDPSRTPRRNSRYFANRLNQRQTA